MPRSWPRRTSHDCPGPALSGRLISGLLPLALLALLVAVVAAQPSQDTWTAPVNVSHSGAASSPAVVVLPDGQLRLFWWDRFDGLTMAQGTGLTTTVWSEPQPVPILVPEAPPPGISATVELVPIQGMPRLVADLSGVTHAFWLGPPDEETHVQPLLHSRLASSRSSWSSPQSIAASAVDFDVTVGPTGTLHLVYITAIEQPLAQPGLYYRSAARGGSAWSKPLAIQQSRYFRLLGPETAWVRLAGDAAGSLYVAWDDPYLARASFARLAPGATAWDLLSPAGGPGSQPARARVVVGPGSGVLFLWEDARFDQQCQLYQSRPDEMDGKRVLEGFAVCPQGEQILPVGLDWVLLAAAEGEALTLAAWDGKEWSEPIRLTFAFKYEDSTPHILTNLQTALVRPAPGASTDTAAASLLVVGVDQQGDVWAATSRAAALDLVSAAPPPWSTPRKMPDEESPSVLPAIAADKRWLHLLWSKEVEAGKPQTALYYAHCDTSVGVEQVADTDSTCWTQPVVVLQTLDGGAQEPALLALDDRLHAVWIGGSAGRIYYSRALARDAHTAEAWSDPVALPAPVPLGARPDIAAGPGGSLHVVYAVPVNEGRGIYYTGSGDGGQTWTDARQIFDAAGAGWLMADYPHLAVDALGGLCVLWQRAGQPGTDLYEGVYFSRSDDGGQTWSEATEIARGDCRWSEIAASGDQVHLFWSETAAGDGWRHAWSSDRGLSWRQTTHLPGFDSVAGPIAVQSGGEGKLHLVGLGGDEQPVLLYTAWNGQKWGEPDQLSPALGGALPGIAAACPAETGQVRLDVLLLGWAPTTGMTPPVSLWYTSRAVQVEAARQVVVPTPVVVPTRVNATLTPSPVLTLTSATPQPSPAPTEVPPATGRSSAALLLPLLASAGLAALVVAGTFGLRYLRSRGRYQRE